MSPAPQDNNKTEYRVPRFPAPRSNGLLREDHASRSVLFLQCEEEGERREFQLKSFDAGSGLSVFRCVICGFEEKLSTKQIDSARAENNKKE